VLVHASEWETPEAARRVFDAYKKIFAGKWNSVSYVNETDTLLEGKGDDGEFRLWLDETRVLGVEGMQDAAEVAAKS